MFGTAYASYVTKMDRCQRNVLIRSIIKEDLAKVSKLYCYALSADRLM